MNVATTVRLQVGVREPRPPQPLPRTSRRRRAVIVTVAGRPIRTDVHRLDDERTLRTSWTPGSSAPDRTLTVDPTPVAIPAQPVDSSPTSDGDHVRRHLAAHQAARRGTRLSGRRPSRGTAPTPSHRSADLRRGDGRGHGTIAQRLDDDARRTARPRPKKALLVGPVPRHRDRWAVASQAALLACAENSRHDAVHSLRLAFTPRRLRSADRDLLPRPVASPPSLHRVRRAGDGSARDLHPEGS